MNYQLSNQNHENQHDEKKIEISFNNNNYNNINDHNNNEINKNNKEINHHKMKKNSMPNLTFNRRQSSDQFSSYIVGRKFSFGQIKVKKSNIFININIYIYLDTYIFY